MALLITTILGGVLGATYKTYKKNADPNQFMINAVAELAFKGGHGATDSLAGPFAAINYIAN